MAASGSRPAKDQAKAQYASVTPYRSGSHTEWMAEHQIARAYADRPARAADRKQAFHDLRNWTAESLEGRGDPDTRLAHHRGTADPAHPSLRPPAQPTSRQGDHR